MPNTFHPYESFRGCSGGTTPGTAALKAYVANDLDPWGTITGSPYGTYNCRGTSKHGEGLALDVGFAFEHGMPNPGGRALARLLIANARGLGLMEVIWDDVRWSYNTPDGAEYTGPSEHRDHVHASQTLAAGRVLTVARIREIVGPRFVPAPALLVVDAGKLKLDGTFDRGVKRIQSALNFVVGAGLVRDGEWGPATAAAYRQWEQNRFQSNGRPGPAELRQLARRSGAFRST